MVFGTGIWWKMSFFEQEENIRLKLPQEFSGHPV